MRIVQDVSQHPTWRPYQKLMHYIYKIYMQYNVIECMIDLEEQHPCIILKDGELLLIVVAIHDADHPRKV